MIPCRIESTHTCREVGIVDILGFCITFPLVDPVVDGIHRFHKVFVDSKPDEVDFWGIWFGLHDVGDDVLAKVLVYEPRRGQAGAEAMAKDVGKLALMMIKTQGSCGDMVCG